MIRKRKAAPRVDQYIGLVGDGMELVIDFSSVDSMKSVIVEGGCELFITLRGGSNSKHKLSKDISADAILMYKKYLRSRK